MITLQQGLSGGKFGKESTFAIAAEFATEGNPMSHTPSTLTTVVHLNGAGCAEFAAYDPAFTIEKLSPHTPTLFTTRASIRDDDTV